VIPSPAAGLVLAGGGHTHALLLNEGPLPAPVTLVSPARFTPYSGMLPGVVAGHYRSHEAHIDLAALCRLRGAAFIEQAATGIDRARQHLLLADGRRLPYHLLSLDIGAQPALDAVPGAREHAIAVKPVSGFLARWQQLLATLPQQVPPPHLAVVGAGAGGTEMVLAMAHALRRRRLPAHLSLFSAGELLPGYPPGVRRRMQRALDRYGIALHAHTPIQRAAAGHLVDGQGRQHPCDMLLWCTGAVGAAWPGDSGLRVTGDGFVRVHDTLQSVNDPALFAAGDCAWTEPAPVPRAGVHAVRQAPVLRHNLIKAWQGKPLRHWWPQRHVLSLLSAGERYAAGSRGRWLSAGGHWLWHVKDRIDRRFMAQFPRAPTHPAE